MKSLNDARYTMWATVLPKLETASLSTGNMPQGAGHYTRGQDPDTGAITNVWSGYGDDPSYNDNPAYQPSYEIQCYARGYTNLGFRSSANREVFVGGEYNVIESVQFDYPVTVALNHQSFITNIRNHKEDTSYLWLNTDTNQPIVWEVQGVTPVTDPFGKLIRYTAVLKRAEVQ